MKFQKPIHWILISCSLLQSGCIHTSSYEHKKLDLASNPALIDQLQGPIQVRSAIYLPSKLPLGDFFRRLQKGEFTEAFRRMDLNYRSSNTDNEVLEQIIENGFIPVYVEITNRGTETKKFNEKSFALVNEKKEVKAFLAEALPNEFQKFNYKAVAANVANTGIVIVGFAAVLGAMIFIESESKGGSTDWRGLGNMGSGGASYDEDNSIYNEINKTTRVDYKSYLISKSDLAPGETKKGLLFFYINEPVSLHDYRLIFTP